MFFILFLVCLFLMKTISGDGCFNFAENIFKFLFH